MYHHWIPDPLLLLTKRTDKCRLLIVDICVVIALMHGKNTNWQGGVMSPLHGLFGDAPQPDGTTGRRRLNVLVSCRWWFFCFKKLPHRWWDGHRTVSNNFFEINVKYRSFEWLDVCYKKRADPPGIGRHALSTDCIGVLLVWSQNIYGWKHAKKRTRCLHSTWARLTSIVSLGRSIISHLKYTSGTDWTSVTYKTLTTNWRMPRVSLRIF